MGVYIGLHRYNDTLMLRTQVTFHYFGRNVRQIYFQVIHRCLTYQNSKSIKWPLRRQDDVKYCWDVSKENSKYLFFIQGHAAKTK